MKNKSIWSQTKIDTSYPKLLNDITTDILIIGGGITGINILNRLQDFDVVLVEKNTLASGTTKNTTGKLTYLQDNMYNEIIKELKFKDASKYLLSQLFSLKEMLKFITDNNIDCDLEKTSSFTYIDNAKDKKEFDTLKHFLDKHGIKYKLNTLKNINYLESIEVANTYLFNPIKYINGLLNLNSKPIYENTTIKDIKYRDGYYYAYTIDGNVIKAKRVILASGYPNFLLPFLFPLKSNNEKSFIISYKDKNIKPTSLISFNKPTLSIRTYKDNVIYLAHSKKICDILDDEIEFKKMIGNKKINYLWSNTDIYTTDYLPYIGKLKDNLYIATGYNTWGMLNSYLAGEIIYSLLSNTKNDYVDLCNPLRKKRLIPILKNIFYNLKGYLKGFKYTKNIIYKKIEGVPVMIYIKNGKEYIVRRKCPHLGCDLLFNSYEECFECPCHASKFDLEGNIIKGPSNYSIKF